MITREDAERIASGVVRQRNDWELVEFDSGWLVLEASAKDRSLRGGSTLVIERSGRIMRFPSSVPPNRIIHEYSEVVEDGFTAMPSFGGWPDPEVEATELASDVILDLDRRHPGELDSVLTAKLAILSAAAHQAEQKRRESEGERM